MDRIAFLGLGAMGSRIAANLIADGHAVTVWNRSPAAVEALVRLGAAVAPSLRAAAEGADRVVAMVYDDAAAEAVWLDPTAGGLAGTREGALGLDFSTLSPALVRRLHAAAADRGVSFLDAPVGGSRP